MPNQPDHLAQSVAALSRFFVGDGTLAETLLRVAELSQQAVPGADFAGITMLVEGRPRTGIFTDEASPDLDATQYETGVGPCLDAFRHQTIYRIDSTEKDTTWPAFSEAASARGVKSTLSLPLVANHEGVGALNLYSRFEGAFSDEDEEVGMQFANQAGIVLANAQAYWDAHQLSQDLNEAMKSRAVIEQAKGILMAQGRNADEAFQILVRASQRENIKLREVAAGLVNQAEHRRPPVQTSDRPA
ncbi:MAG TPA: GAF and ANTAR domain-containing protein [Acidimicrobiales bacterium]|nr:GAF and ANTAR domain-containing protein [Acidimicrobiales bacterium]